MPRELIDCKFCGRRTAEREAWRNPGAEMIPTMYCFSCETRWDPNHRERKRKPYKSEDYKHVQNVDE